jgi:Tol biopolymer transport system component
VRLPATIFVRSVLHFAASLAFALGAMAQSSSESLLTTDNAYNPIPSPDGKYIAYIRTGWGEKGFTSLGRSSLVSDVKIMNVVGTATRRTLAKDYFISGWTPDSTRIVCYRDWNYALVSTDGKRTMVGRIPNDPNLNLPTEWVAYSPSLESLVWSRQIDKSHRAIETPSRTIVKDEMFWEGRVVASPDGRYLAVFRQDSQMDFRVYDLRLQSWTDLGMMSIHPDGDWWYIQPDWNPWFADGSRLVFLRDSTLVIANPHSTEKIEIKIDGPAGLPVPSPDGKSIAYVTFEPRPKQMRPDLQFWGGTTIMVVGTSGEPKPRAVTTKNPDEVYDLKWLNNDALIFDRVADDAFYQHARIWKVAVPR